VAREAWRLLDMRFYPRFLRRADAGRASGSRMILRRGIHG
jgi:hypothetical protein